jgi:hypothetical protein
MVVSGDLECALRSLADLVQFVPKGIDLPFDLLEGRALGHDKQASILAPGVAEEGNLHVCRVVRCSGRLLGLRVRPHAGDRPTGLCLCLPPLKHQRDL